MQIVVYVAYPNDLFFRFRLLWQGTSLAYEKKTSQGFAKAYIDKMTLITQMICSSDSAFYDREHP